MSTCFVITCYTLDYCSRLAIRVCAVVDTEEQADSYLFENKVAQPDEFGHEVHEIEKEE